MSDLARAAQGAEAKARSIDEIMARKRQQVQTVYLLLEPELEEQRQALVKELAKAEAYDKWHNERDTAPGIKERIREIEERIAESRQPFVFKSIGRSAYAALLDEFKPRDGNEDDDELGFNADEFPPRLIALSSHEPEISLEDAYKIWNEWSDAETTQLLSGAILANKEVVDVPFTIDGLPIASLSTGTPSPIATTEDSNTPTG